MPDECPSNPAVEPFQSDGFKGQRSPLVSLKAALPRDGAEIIPRSQGVDVIVEISYSPGGWVPGRLVRWCQTLGAERMMNEIRQLALEF